MATRFLSSFTLYTYKLCVYMRFIFIYNKIHFFNSNSDICNKQVYIKMFPQTGYEKPGSISLQTNLPMDYSRGVLSNKWHQKREAEPRDHELWSGNRPNLHQSTYIQLQKNVQSDVRVFF